jgi:hypothetical protein
METRRALVIQLSFLFKQQFNKNYRPYFERFRFLDGDVRAMLFDSLRLVVDGEAD